MIAQLSGTVIESSFTNCVIDCGGVGYDVQIPLSTFDKLPQPGEKAVLKIHTAVREDAIMLFGFISAEEKKLFEMLINVSGIGGKLALNVLSGMPVATFCSAIASGDAKSLSRISGIGKRTAERLVVELKGKVQELGGAAVGELKPQLSQAFSDTAGALEQLGFKRDAIDRVLTELALEYSDEEADGEKMLRAAIRKLSF